MTYTKLITLLVVAIGMVQTADAGLQWVAIGNQPNANNTNAVLGIQNMNNNGADTGEFTIGVIPSADQLTAAASNSDLNNISSYAVNMTFDLIGAADGKMFDVQAENLITDLDFQFGDAVAPNGPLTLTDNDLMNNTAFFSQVRFGVAQPTLTGLAATADSNGVIPVLKLVVSLPTGDFMDGAANPFSQIVLTLDADHPSEPGRQTQFGLIGSKDAPQNADPLFDASPTANPNDPNVGLSVDGHTLQVGTAPAVPEPSSFLCLSMIVFATGGARWYRKRQAVAVSEEA